MPTPLLRRGSTGPLVAKAQAKLDRLGYETTVERGTFGAITEAAVADFQSKAGLVATGEIDDATWEKMDDAERGLLRDLRNKLGKQIKEYDSELVAFVRRHDQRFTAHSYHAQLQSVDDLIATQEEALRTFLAKIRARQAMPDTCGGTTAPAHASHAMALTASTAPVEDRELPQRTHTPKTPIPGTPSTPTTPPQTPPPVWQDCCKQLDQAKSLKQWIYARAVLYAQGAESEVNSELQSVKALDAADWTAMYYEADKDVFELASNCAKLKVQDLHAEEDVLHSSNKTLAEFLGLLQQRVEVERSWLRTEVDHLENKAKLIGNFKTMLGDLATVLCKEEG